MLEGDADDSGLQRLSKRAVARQAKAYTAVRRLLSSARFNGFLLDLLLAAEQGSAVISDPDSPLRPVAAAHLQKRHKNVMKVGRDFAAMQNEERHEVRIALKKLRYACDYFQRLFPGKASIAYLDHMAALQDDLGRLNDATVAELLVDDLAGDDAVAAHGGALVKGWYRHRLRSVEPHMLGAWAAFADDLPFWRK